jgi:hypothetical protein
MISFRTAEEPKRPADTPVFRKRLISCFSRDPLLYAVTTSSRTEIIQVSLDGVSKTVIAFNTYMDIVCGDLSSDNEIIAYTERVPSGARFAFKSSLCHIHSFANVKVFEEPSPLFSFFLHEKNSKVYDVLHVLGGRITHCQVISNGRALEVKKVRTGVNLSSCSRWFFWDGVFYAIHDQKTISLFSFANGRFQAQAYPAEPDPAAVLPAELALLPSVPGNSPFYRFSRGNWIVIPMKCGDYGVVEQLYRGCDSSLTFSVWLVRRSFKKVVAVPGVEPDLPINFICHEAVVSVFIPNKFIAVVDLTGSWPSIALLPHVLSSAPIFGITVPISLTNMIVDLGRGVVYDCRLSFEHLPTDHSALDFDNRSVVSLFAILTCRLPKYLSLSALFQRLPSTHECLLLFFQIFFETGLSAPRERAPFPPPLIPSTIAAILEEIEHEFPSAGRISRTESFVRIYAGLRGLADPSDAALAVLQSQNSLALTLRAALDDWIARTNPDDFTRFSVGFTALSESIFVSAPAVQCLREEVETSAREISGNVIVARLRGARLVGANSLCMTEAERAEITYFGAKLPPSVISRAPMRSSHLTLTASASSSLAHRSKQGGLSEESEAERLWRSGH